MEKQNDDFMTGKLNILRPSLKAIIYQLSLIIIIITTGHNIKWDHFDILASGKTDLHCKIKETLFIQELKPSLNANVGS